MAPDKVGEIDAKDDGTNEKQNGDFPKRQPGGRVHLAEQEEKRDKLSNHKELLHAAANLDKQQEVLDDAGAEKEYNVNGADDLDNKNKEAKIKDEKSVNRPLVDGLDFLKIILALIFLFFSSTRNRCLIVITFNKREMKM